jgi:hypothetical protein
LLSGVGASPIRFANPTWEQALKLERYVLIMIQKLDLPPFYIPDDVDRPEAQERAKKVAKRNRPEAVSDVDQEPVAKRRRTG